MTQWLIEGRFADGPVAYFQRQHIASVWVGISGNPRIFTTKREAQATIRKYGLTRATVVQHPSPNQ